MKEHVSNDGKDFLTRSTHQAGLPPILPQSSSWSLSERCPEINVNTYLCIFGLVFWRFCFALPLKVETQGLRWPVRRKEGRSWGKELSSSGRLDPKTRGEERVRAKRGWTGDSWKSESFTYLKQMHPWENMLLEASFICSYINWCVVKAPGVNDMSLLGDEPEVFVLSCPKFKNSRPFHCILADDI